MPGIAAEGLSVSRWYRLLYAVGITPWEQDTETLAPQLGTLLTIEEARRAAPYGRALDMGCGTGRWSVELARRGWHVVGVDVIPKAVSAARRRAEAAGVDVTFVEGDVTDLRGAVVGSGFSFVLDVECFNHLTDSQREAVGREINAVTSADASLLVLAWTRARRGPLPPGATPGDLMAALPGWQITDEQAYDGALPLPLKNVAPRWYRLRRA